MHLVIIASLLIVIIIQIVEHKWPEFEINGLGSVFVESTEL